jgi:hypothetical protein
LAVGVSTLPSLSALVISFVRGILPRVMNYIRPQGSGDRRATSLGRRVELGESEGGSAVLLRVHATHLKPTYAPEKDEHHAARMARPSGGIRTDLVNQTPVPRVDVRQTVGQLEV